MLHDSAHWKECIVIDTGTASMSALWHIKTVCLFVCVYLAAVTLTIIAGVDLHLRHKMKTPDMPYPGLGSGLPVWGVRLPTTTQTAPAVWICMYSVLRQSILTYVEGHVWDSRSLCKASGQTQVVNQILDLLISGPLLYQLAHRFSLPNATLVWDFKIDDLEYKMCRSFAGP